MPMCKVYMWMAAVANDRPNIIVTYNKRHLAIYEEKERKKVLDT